MRRFSFRIGFITEPCPKENALKTLSRFVAKLSSLIVAMVQQHNAFKTTYSHIIPFFEETMTLEPKDQYYTAEQMVRQWTPARNETSAADAGLTGTWQARH
jgi:hypothetical protein